MKGKMVKNEVINDVTGNKTSLNLKNFGFIWKRNVYWTKNIITVKPEFYFTSSDLVICVLLEISTFLAWVCLQSPNLFVGKFDEWQILLIEVIKREFKPFHNNIFCSVEVPLSNKPKFFEIRRFFITDDVIDDVIFDPFSLYMYWFSD